MSGSLIKIDEELVTSAVASVELGGTDWDSSYDVYMVKYDNVIPTTDTQVFNFRFLVSGSADTSANYDYAGKILESTNPFTNFSNTNQTSLRGVTYGNQTGEAGNGVLYLFNFNNASEYSFCTLEEVARASNTAVAGLQGGGVLTVSQATNGIQFFMASGNIDTGAKFTLYGLKK